MPDEGAEPWLALAFAQGADHEQYVRVATTLGWRCSDFLSRESSVRSCSPALLIAAPAYAALARNTLPPGAGVAVVGTASDALLDEEVPPEPSDALLAALIERWRPMAMPDAVARQIHAFGHEQMAPLLTRLRTRLVDALSGPVDETGAHQLAGIAGLLGFADVAASWEAMSCDGESDAREARRAARRAVAALDRSGVCAPQR